MCANAVGCMCAPPNCYVNPVGAASINKPFFSGTRTLVVSNRWHDLSGTITICVYSVLDICAIHPPVKWTLLELSSFTSRGLWIVTQAPFFSDTYDVIHRHSRRSDHLFGRLRFLCIDCWLHVRPVQYICQPCGGCVLINHLGVESDLL